MNIILNLDSLNIFIGRRKQTENGKSFSKELLDYLENTKEIKQNNQNEERPIINQIISNNNLTTGNKNSIIWNENNLILEYAKENFNNKAMYFVKDNKKIYWLKNKKHYNNDIYSVLKVENNKIVEVEMRKEDMPREIRINDVFQMEDDKYVFDSISTKELKEEITKMAEKIIDKQNKNLEKYRKEGHLYVITEEIGNNRFLKDLSNSSKTEFEEVDIPRDLLDKATEGMVLKYNNGKYEYYSDDGYRL